MNSNSKSDHTKTISPENIEKPSSGKSSGDNNVFKVINTDQIINPATLHGNYVFRFEMENIVTGEIAILFFNVEKSKSGYKVKPDSKFAKLYRLTTGEDPKSRYSKAHQLTSHFIDECFKCRTKLNKYTKGDEYILITEANPINPIVMNEWTKTGSLKGKNRRRYNTTRTANKQLTIKKTGDQYSEKKPQHTEKISPLTTPLTLIESEVIVQVAAYKEAKNEINDVRDTDNYDSERNCTPNTQAVDFFIPTDADESIYYDIF